MRNSSLVENLRAENARDSSILPKLWIRPQGRVVEERSVQLRSGTERSRGADRSDNVGMSSDKQGENPCHRKPEDSWARFVLPGLVGP